MSADILRIHELISNISGRLSTLEAVVGTMGTSADANAAIESVAEKVKVAAVTEATASANATVDAALQSLRAELAAVKELVKST
jgi:hypothetical protein